MKPVFSTFVIALVMGSIGSRAAAEDVCTPAEELKASLIDWYAERPVAEPDANGQQVWASERTGTWTMVAFEDDGVACVVAQGDDWMAGPAGGQELAALQE